MNLRLEKRRNLFQTFLIFIFSLIWRKRLWNCKKIIRVTGWNSCLMDTKVGVRQRVTFLFSGHRKLDEFVGISQHINTSNIKYNPNDTSTTGLL